MLSRGGGINAAGSEADAELAVSLLINRFKFKVHFCIVDVDMTFIKARSQYFEFHH